MPIIDCFTVELSVKMNIQFRENSRIFKYITVHAVLSESNLVLLEGSNFKKGYILLSRHI